jgi:hypothetical protein
VQQWLNLKKNMAAIEKAYHERSAYSDSDPDDEIVVCDIGSSKDGHKMVCVKSWKKQIRIDIREFYLQDGMRMPQLHVCDESVKKGVFVVYEML